MKNHIVLSGLLLFCLASLHPLFALDSTEVEEVIAENLSGEIHLKANKARIMRNAGIPLSACGAISVPVGFVLMATADITSWYFGSDGLRCRLSIYPSRIPSRFPTFFHPNVSL